MTQKGLCRHSLKVVAQRKTQMEKNPKVMRVVCPFCSLNFAREVVAVVACAQI